MHIIARQVDTNGRLWLARPTWGGLIEPGLPSHSHTLCSLHASRPADVGGLAAEALRDGRSVCAYDEHASSDRHAFPAHMESIFDALKRLLDEPPACEWNVSPLTRLEGEADVLRWFLSSSVDLLVLGNVAFEKRRQVGSTPPIGRGLADGASRFATSYAPA